MSVELSANYRPTAKEPFMNERQREYFRRKLVNWRAEVIRDFEATRANLENSSGRSADLVDTANDDTDRALELRTRDREYKLIAKIDEALLRIRQGTYGFCTETGKPIGLARLEARPTAALCIEAQEAHERRETRDYRETD